MALTKEQLKKIEEIIQKHFLRLTYEATGESALTESEIQKLKDYGLLRPNVRHFTGDAYTLGRLVSTLDKADAKSISMMSVKNAGRRMPITDVQRRAMEFASSHAGEYIKGIGTDIAKDFRTAAARSSRTALQQVQAEVKTAVKDRLTISQLKSNLHHSIKGKKRDWLKVASTEMTDAIQHGIYDEIKRNSGGEEALVYKRPSPQACKHCKRQYLRADGVTPRIFKMSSLTETNIGLKADSWTPTIGPVHPFCQCQLSLVPKGWNFKKKVVASESFGRYKAGQVIDDITTLSEDERKKTRLEAILQYTGEEAEEDGEELEKSFHESDEDDVCECNY